MNQRPRRSRKLLTQGTKLKRSLKSPRFVLVIGLILCLLVCLFTPLNAFFNQSVLISYLETWGHWAVCWFLGVYTLATILGIPGTLLTVAGGAVFGLIWGTVWSVFGATLGAIGAFWVARYLFRDWVKNRFEKHNILFRFNQAIKDQPLTFILAVRFAPISPFNLVNFLFGLTPIKSRDYAIGTFLGIIPGTLAYTWLGVTGKDALSGGDRIPFFLALGFLGLLSLLPMWAKRRGT